MVSTIQNIEVLQKDADRAVVVAVTFNAVFESADDEDDVYRVGVASQLLQAMQRMNQHLLEKNQAEFLLFDVILITTDHKQKQQSTRIINSTTHHGLQVSRFCFSSEKNFIESLLKNDVHLFLTTDKNEAEKASHKGVLSSLVDQQVPVCLSEKLRVMFCDEAFMQPNTGRRDAQSFLAKLGEMQQRFSLFTSPLVIVLLISHGGQESFCSALKMLRKHGVSVDQAYCLAGAPRDPILSVVRPHLMFGDSCLKK